MKLKIKKASFIAAGALAAVVRKHYNPIADPKGCDGAQMWNGQWWMPRWGCDTLGNMLDDMTHAIERQQAANDPSSLTADPTHEND